MRHDVMSKPPIYFDDAYTIKNTEKSKYIFFPNADISLACYEAGDIVLPNHKNRKSDHWQGIPFQKDRVYVVSQDETWMYSYQIVPLDYSLLDQVLSEEHFDKYCKLKSGTRVGFSYLLVTEVFGSCDKISSLMMKVNETRACDKIDYIKKLRPKLEENCGTYYNDFYKVDGNFFKAIYLYENYIDPKRKMEKNVQYLNNFKRIYAGKNRNINLTTKYELGAKIGLKEALDGKQILLFTQYYPKPEGRKIVELMLPELVKQGFETVFIEGLKSNTLHNPTYLYQPPYEVEQANLIRRAQRLGIEIKETVSPNPEFLNLDSPDKRKSGFNAHMSNHVIEYLTKFPGKKVIVLAFHDNGSIQKFKDKATFGSILYEKYGEKLTSISNLMIPESDKLKGTDWFEVVSKKPVAVGINAHYMLKLIPNFDDCIANNYKHFGYDEMYNIRTAAYHNQYISIYLTDELAISNKNKVPVFAKFSPSFGTSIPLSSGNYTQFIHDEVGNLLSESTFIID